MAGRHQKPDSQRRWQEFPELPPRPDATTGQPRPPHAPGYPAQAERQPRQSRPPRADAGQALAWHRKRLGSVHGIAVAAILAAVLLVAAFLIGGDLPALVRWSAWPAWLAVLLFAILMGGAGSHAIAAGADWVQVRQRSAWFRPTRTTTIHTYDVTRINGHDDVGWSTLSLEDSHGGTLLCELELLHANRDIWDLVHNGLVHSVANGATIDTPATRILRLDETPALDLRSQHQDRST